MSDYLPFRSAGRPPMSDNVKPPQRTPYPTPGHDRTVKLPDFGTPAHVGSTVIFPGGTAIAARTKAASHREVATEALDRAALHFAAALLLDKEEAEKAARAPYHRLNTAIAASTICSCTEDDDACDAHAALAELEDELDRLRRAAADA